MRTLVVYYSRSGHTKMVAEEISNALKCDIEPIIDTKSRKGIIGWLSAGKDATLGDTTKIKEILKDVSSYDLVIIGGPVWSWNISPAVRTFMLQYMEQLKNAAFFCTEDGGGAKRSFRNLAALLGKQPVATLEIKASSLNKEEHKRMISDFVDTLRR